jgi:hypothetical protein
MRLRDLPINEPEFAMRVAGNGLGFSARAQGEGEKILWKDGLSAGFTILGYQILD